MSRKWGGIDTGVCDAVRRQSDANLAAYAANPALVREQFNIELATAEGGYQHRQLYELVQNAADALLGSVGGRIEVILAGGSLYCANEGIPFDDDGATAILQAYHSPKRGAEIGRFGLGFKSVLGISDEPLIFSRSGSFGFSRERSRSEVLRVVPGAEGTPVLRVAEVIDAAASFAVDETLKELSTWATTIVKLPLVARVEGFVADEMARFPAEFVLFGGSVGKFVLDDRSTGRRRAVELRRDGDDLVLTDQGTSTRWRVFESLHKPSSDARSDAGEIIFREEVPLQWAVPLERRGVGQFWAFFPTEYMTTLSGILNAPWKTNSDRQNLLRGAFNDELISYAAELVIGALPSLVDPSDPGRFLELLPGRGREGRNWADEQLGEAVLEAARSSPSVPDQDGELRLPAVLQLHPDVPIAAVDEWASFPDRPTGWVHRSVVNRDRRARAERLIGRVAGISEWLEALVEARTPASSAAAIRVAARLIESDVLTGAAEREVRSANIVLTNEGRWLPIDPRRISTSSEASGLGSVHPGVLSVEGTRSALSTLGIGEVDAEAELNALLARIESRDFDWDQAWQLARVVGSEKAAQLLERVPLRQSRLRVRVVSGEWAPVTAVLLPGPVASPERDPRVAVDLEYHKGQESVLKAIDVVAEPSRDGGQYREPWYADYLEDARRRYDVELKKHIGQNPRRDLIDFEPREFPGPLAPIIGLSPESSALFIDELLKNDPDLTPWLLRHTSRPSAYPTLKVASPVRWLARQYGWVDTSHGMKPVPSAVGPELERHADLMPVARIDTKAATSLGMPRTIESIKSGHWQRLFDAARSLEPSLIGSLLALAVGHLQAPSKIPATVGDRCQLLPPSDVIVTTVRSTFDFLREAGTPCVLAPERAASDLAAKWGARLDQGEHSVRIEFDPEGPELLLIDVYRPLRHLLPASLSEVTITRCTDIRRVAIAPTGSESRSLLAAVDGDRIFCGAAMVDIDVLDFVNIELALGLAPEDLAAVVTSTEDSAIRERLAAVRNEPTLHDRILAAMTVSAVRRHVPQQLIESIERDRSAALTPAELVEVAHALHGVDLLKELSAEFSANGFDPPRSWRGRSVERQWVKSIGFPIEYAGEEAPRRDPLIVVEGPARLHPLHDFQRSIADRIRQAVSATKANRGLVSLPTGAGKTRTAVQALVEMMAEEELRGVVLWVAQNDELCEQAVQAWGETWRALGSFEALAISRLWGSNEVEEAGSLQIVVATIDKLTAIIGNEARAERYGWLATPACVVIDEAHGSTTPEYTGLLQWLDLGRTRRSRPLIGLTATPFRGTSASETERLVRRYDGVRLDEDVFEDDPYAYLQKIGVLARVRHRVLAGQTIDLTDSERDELAKLRRLPRSVEARIGADENRNRVLIDSLLTLGPDDTALVFAASVDHAQMLAVRLTLEGVPAAAIFGSTPTALRRSAVGRFKRGELRVLTNYAVFAEGFDAPAVKAVYVARPTFSPNLYQQMIGRGLRGPLNGGKEECLIVDVADNVERYGGELAFHDFERLWRQPEEPSHGG